MNAAPHAEFPTINSFNKNHMPTEADVAPQAKTSGACRASRARLRRVTADDPSNETLMLAYRRGDADAFKQLFERYAPLLLALGRRHLRSDNLAQDLVQKTFLKLHAARMDFREGRSLHPWLLTIAMNLVRDEWRHQQRKPTAALDFDPADDAPQDLSPDGLESQQRFTRLREGLAKLSDKDRLVLELHWFQDRGFPEIAAVLGISQGAARVRAHRAGTRLRDLLGVPLEELL